MHKLAGCDKEPGRSLSTLPLLHREDLEKRRMSLAAHSIRLDEDPLSLDASSRLFVAIQQGDIAAINGAIQAGANVNVYSVDELVPRRTPLRLACALGQADCVTCLLGAGALVFAHYPQDQWTALHSASLRGEELILRQLVVDGQDVINSLDGFPLLHVGCEVISPVCAEGGRKFIEFLMKYANTNLNAKSRRTGFHDWTCLHVCALRGKMKTAGMLIKAGADMLAVTGDVFVQSRRLNEAAKGGVVPLHLDGDIVASEGTEAVYWDTGLSPIHLACMGGHVRLAVLFLRAGISPTIRTSRHAWTPLHFAVWSGSPRLVQEICRLGGRQVVNAVDRRPDYQNTPLTLAAARGNVEVVQILLTYGADPVRGVRMMDFPGKELLPSPADRWSSEDSRITPLHIAIARGDVPIVEAVTKGITKSEAFERTRIRRLEERGIDPGSIAGMARPRVTLGSGPATQAALPTDLGTADDWGPISSRVPWPGRKGDPYFFETHEGWTPLTLALCLAAVDPTNARDGLSFVRIFPRQPQNNRREVVRFLLTTGRCLPERGDVIPPLFSRLGDMGDDTSRQIIAESADACMELRLDTGLIRATHGALVVAAKLNKYEVAKFILEQRLANPRCEFIHPKSSRPLHVACALGHGRVAQILIDYGADASEEDENGLKPVEKLCDGLARRIDASVMLDASTSHPHTHWQPTSGTGGGFPSPAQTMTTRRMSERTIPVVRDEEDDDLPA
ncbi:unnamed protein product [Vitrella brassicaformis CCMP3155]|uniref:Uncharacterized protein n=1 Tax=Vitrella brassicaformis (strain CCMP3155) TaxID=1169540 RepID=A0A0G4GBM1_VITBC|nr:unnamed protein product [Vitrella brassicaformis CCMP3155]|eukprot:CEM26420.1 unnamed protein product [Vitrella brassicaformis CCMP3155]